MNREYGIKVKEIVRPSGFAVSLYKHDNLYFVGVSCPSGASRDVRFFEVYEKADEYFEVLLEALQDSYYN